MDMTVRTRHETTNRVTGLGLEVWEREMGFPIPSPSCCSTAHAPVEVEMWVHRFGRLAERRRPKKTGGEHALDQPQKCVGAFSEKAPGLDPCPINAPPSLASPTAHSWRDRLKSRYPAHGPPSKDRQFIYPDQQPSPPKID